MRRYYKWGKVEIDLYHWAIGWEWTPWVTRRGCLALFVGPASIVFLIK